MPYASVLRADLFAGCVVWVTGGGSGIGRAIAHELASLGAHVVLSGRRVDRLDKVAGEVRDDGGAASVVALDIRDDVACGVAVQHIVAEHGRLDGLVNNAGGQFASPAALIRPKGWRAVIDTNLNGTWFATHAAFSHWMAEHGGAIVNVVADMWNGFPGMAHTGAARAAVVNLTQTLAVEWASSGVRVNAVAPGFIASEGLANYPVEVQEVAATMTRQNPASRLGTEEEVAAAVTWLLSPAAAYITGATLRVDGGGSLQKAPLVPLIEHDRLPPFRALHRPSAVPAIFR
ncbi:MAG: SDR family oxidoreductase [Myxococcales bacterium]|nr:SDR family oxidoreductase [Myxococcales bacterium]